MRVFVTGATGFVGRALVLRLLREGHDVHCWTRDVDRARDLLGPDVMISSDDSGVSFDHGIARADAIVNLAGENLFSGRWTAARKERIAASRIDGTKRIAESITAAPRRSRALISASAVGVFGDRRDEVLTEASAAGDDFLAQVCVDWEGAAMAASSPTTRVAVLRFGLVFGSEGGALSRLLPLFKAGLGGRLGSGSQWMSWIHLHDLVSLIVTAIDRDDFEGVLHAVAPEPVTNEAFTQTLATALDRPGVLAVPGVALKVVLGEASGVLLGGQRAIPQRTVTRGFSFGYPTLRDAFGQILDTSREPAIRRAPRGLRPVDDRPAAQYVLEQDTTIAAPLSEVFPFFSVAANLALLTPTWTDFRILEHPEGETLAGSEIVYRLKLFGVPIRWRTRIARWVPGSSFVDTQLSGPYRLWWHEHEFAETASGGVHMVDRVSYTVPLGPLGRIANSIMVAPLLRRIFAWRAEAIALRFDPLAATPPRDGRRVA